LKNDVVVKYVKSIEKMSEGENRKARKHH